MDRYAPDEQVLPNGMVSHSYGRAHALRQADAVAALEEIDYAQSRVVAVVECRDRVVASVYRTLREDDLDLVVLVHAPKAVNPELHGINRELGRSGDDRIMYARDGVADPLRAPTDRDLEHTCRCGQVHEIDRYLLLERIAFGERTIPVASVSA